MLLPGTCTRGGAVVGASGCGSAGPGRGAGTRHSLGALELAFAPPCAADQRVEAERDERGLQLAPRLPPRRDRASRCGQRGRGAQRALPPGRPLTGAQLPPRSPRNRAPRRSPDSATRTSRVPIGPFSALARPIRYPAAAPALALAPAVSGPAGSCLQLASRAQPPSTRAPPLPGFRV